MQNVEILAAWSAASRDSLNTFKRVYKRLVNGKAFLQKSQLVIK